MSTLCLIDLLAFPCPKLDAANVQMCLSRLHRFWAVWSNWSPSPELCPGSRRSGFALFSGDHGEGLNVPID